eukprot:153985-Alexandrium_andersonii.AAC.1
MRGKDVCVCVVPALPASHHSHCQAALRPAVCGGVCMRRREPRPRPSSSPLGLTTELAFRARSKPA